MEPEDLNTAINLREVRSKEDRSRLKHLWDEATKFINWKLF